MSGIDRSLKLDAFAPRVSETIDLSSPPSDREAGKVSPLKIWTKPVAVFAALARCSHPDFGKELCTKLMKPAPMRELRRVQYFKSFNAPLGSILLWHDRAQTIGIQLRISRIARVPQGFPAWIDWNHPRLSSDRLRIHGPGFRWVPPTYATRHRSFTN
ncbi:MAG: hypothetical protein IPH15_10315 [Comamonadaceae bacterium]|nr:hypothetical protein [Comamonadaceae bacterium]